MGEDLSANNKDKDDGEQQRSLEDLYKVHSFYYKKKRIRRTKTSEPKQLRRLKCKPTANYRNINFFIVKYSKTLCKMEVIIINDGDWVVKCAQAQYHPSHRF